MDFVQEALKFLKIKSVSEDGDEEIVNFLIPIFEQMGAKLVLQQVPHSLKDHSKRQYNLLAIFGDDLVDSRTKKGLLLTAPIDTCNAGQIADWTELNRDPWSPIHKDGYLIGPGSVNSKLNFLAMVAAAESFSSSPLPKPLYIAATCGGESSLVGTKYLIQSGAVNPKHVIVGRPTNLKLQNTEKAHINFQIKISFVAVEKDAQEFNAKVFVTSKSKGKHTAHPDSEKNALENVLFFLENLKASPIESKLISLHGAGGLNRTPDSASAGIVIRSKDLDAIRDRFRSLSANNRDCLFEMRLGGTGDRGVKILSEEIYKAIRLIREQIKEVNENMAPMRDPAFQPDFSRVILTSISQERDAIELTVQYQLLPEFASNENRAEIEQDFKNRMQGVAKNFRSISVDCRKLSSSSRFYIDPQTTFMNTLLADMQRSGLSPETHAGNFYTESSLFMEKGFEAVAFGAGDYVQAGNCPNEKILVENLLTAQRFYSRAIEAFCLRGI